MIRGGFPGGGDIEAESLKDSGALICVCEYSRHGRFQATNLMSLHPELGRDVCGQEQGPEERAPVRPVQGIRKTHPYFWVFWVRQGGTPQAHGNCVVLGLLGTMVTPAIVRVWKE